MSEPVDFENANMDFLRKVVAELKIAKSSNATVSVLIDVCANLLKQEPIHHRAGDKFPFDNKKLGN